MYEDSHVGTHVCRKRPTAARVLHSPQGLHSEGCLLGAGEGRKCDALTMWHPDLKGGQVARVQQLLHLRLDDIWLEVANEDLQRIQPIPGHGSHTHTPKEACVLEPMEMQMYVCGTHTHT